METYYVAGDPKVFGWTFEGTASASNDLDVTADAS
jgi:hypothetical protein